MTNEKTERKKRTPKSYESILNGSLKLELEDQVKLVIELVKQLKQSIEAELESIEEKAAQAKQIVNGL